MANQVDKFKAKYGLDKLDEGSMMKAELAKKQRILDRIADVLNDEEAMMKTAGIQEAAAVFSYAGLDILARSYGNSVGRIFRDEALPMFREVIREVVREEAGNILRGLLKGQKESLEEELGAVMQVATEDDLEAPESAPEAPAPETKRKITSRAESREQARRIANLLKQEARGVKLKEIVQTFPDIKFGSVPTDKMKSIMKYETGIVSAGFGLYAYQT